MKSYKDVRRDLYKLEEVMAFGNKYADKKYWDDEKLEGVYWVITNEDSKSNPDDPYYSRMRGIHFISHDSHFFAKNYLEAKYYDTKAEAQYVLDSILDDDSRFKFYVKKIVFRQEPEDNNEWHPTIY